MTNIGLLAAVVAIISLSLQNASAFSTGAAAHDASHSRLEYFKPISTHRGRVPARGRIQEQMTIPSLLQATNSNEENETISPTPLCDLQTFLRLCNLVQSGGEAKNVIQNSQCKLNDVVETRRSKKLFPGDTVTFGGATNLDVAAEVKKKGYVYKPKVKKVKPLPRVDAEGNLEFGGRYRSEEWRAERKLKKEERKKKNQGSK
eukprot:CAMPEP_0201730856 /NCGR_PEP_ID=MMETSP0593-20130828/23816_1 /ASSEMBLY_ACC=CAM_ASM_000672 /TAXON_ID=267983 /ORGANISM="Skeletonema japonicum, Strain CCMP2506" /LENGTH=202 /DNA_ID=CAMNT_0048223509 /DNA_START=8 /DNA_END=616 /DNA_ORIENTATION=+